eukprot:scaffold27285_cov107-Isochrysis_galbana.AAC.4
MGSATWSQIPSHAGWGEGGGDDGRGDEESIRWGNTAKWRNRMSNCCEVMHPDPTARCRVVSSPQLSAV